MGRFTTSIVVGAGVTLAWAGGATGAPVADGFAEPTISQTYATDGQPALVRYAYGAAWVGTKARTLVRVAPGSAVPRTTRFPGAIVDVSEGFGRIWVLWRIGPRSYVTPVNSTSGRIVGPVRRTRVPGRPGRIRAGAGAVWVAEQGDRVTARGVLTRLDPRNRRVVTRRWPKPTDFFVERGLLWSFNGFKLVARRPGDLRVRHRVPAFSGFQGAAYGLGDFWASSAGTTGNGGVTRISPTRGRDPEVLPFPSDLDVGSGGSITTGGGSVWSAWEIAPSEVGSASPWALVGFSPSGAQEGFVGLPIDGTPSIAYGAGSLWVTDPGGGRLLQIVPPGS